MKSWYLWCSSRMPAGGAVAQVSQLPSGPRCPRSPRATGRDSRSSFECSLAIGRLESPEFASRGVFFLGAQDGGRAPLAL